MKSNKYYIHIIITTIIIFCTNVEIFASQSLVIYQPSIYSNTELGKYVTSQMLQHSESIDVSAYKGDLENIKFILPEVINQNPLIGMIKRCTYMYSTNILEIEYIMGKEETTRIQNDTKNKINSIIPKIIRPGMSTVNKELAINNYLRDNAYYDVEAVNANITGTNKSIEPYYGNAYAPYGVLIDGKGVCMSYATAFKMLCEAAGIECLVITGHYKDQAHAWNRVKIEDEWFLVDVTNNDNPIIPNAYFNLPDSTANKLYTPNKTYIMPEVHKTLTSTSEDLEYYTLMGMYVEYKNLPDELNKKVYGDKPFIIRTKYDISTDEFTDILGKSLAKAKNTRGMSVLNLHGTFLVTPE